MRFIHTADWHLGKTLKNQSLIDDQKYILNEFLKIVDDCNVEAVIIAGDIYDKYTPPEEAVQLFDWILTELVIVRNLHVLCIAGNHDSADRLNFGSRIFDSVKFHIRAKIADSIEPIILDDEYGKVYFSLIPYFEPAIVKKFFKLNEETNITFNEAGKLLIEAARSKINAAAKDYSAKIRSIAVTHAFIAGGKESGSERSLPGGAGKVNTNIFKDYNYTALGHLHSPHMMGKNIKYSGSLLKYSFDEWHQDKSVTLIEMDGDGQIITNENIPLRPKYDVRVIKADNVEDIVKSAIPSDDYISVQYRNRRTIDFKTKLDAKFKNMLELKQIDKKLADISIEQLQRRDNLPKIDLFQEFFQAVTDKTMTSAELEILNNLIEDIERSI